VTYSPSGGLGRLTEVIVELESRETDARRRARTLEGELADALLRAASTTALLELRERHIQERGAAEAAIRAELRAARAELRIARLRLDALEDGRVRLEGRLEEVERERARLLVRSDRLDAFTKGRTYRFVQWTWRVRAALARPFRRRRAGG
jgi:chromosome segregation ATPase